VKHSVDIGKDCTIIQQLTLLTGIDDDNDICRESLQSHANGQRSVDRRTQCGPTYQASGQGRRVEDSRLMCGERWLTKGSPFE
jgi:hypothetical protein